MRELRPIVTGGDTNTTTNTETSIYAPFVPTLTTPTGRANHSNGASSTDPPMVAARSSTGTPGVGDRQNS